jgi:hypothetical protein
MIYREISDCRLCDGDKLVGIFNLGQQALTGVFPRTPSADVATGPLELIKCAGCHLVQLRHNYDLSQLYGDTYGYRSGLNQTMVQHLHDKVARVRGLVQLQPGDLVIDIGANDSTLLQAYPGNLALVGVDPSGPKFRRFYPPHISLIPDFFSSDRVKKEYPNKRPKVITSIAMFYDLERPQDFVDEVAGLLDDEGVWVFEQSYLPFMLETNSYDTICHEHLEYYGLAQIKRMMDKAELKIVDLQFNDVNGGSFSITASRRKSKYAEASAMVESTLANEAKLGLAQVDTYRRFAERAANHKRELMRFLGELKRAGKRVFGYGASTKGNVLIQYCGIGPDLVSCIAEVNEDKYGAFTPRSRIRIVSEAEARAQTPDYFIVFPWHFRGSILRREQAFLQRGGRFIFPLPQIEIVSAAGVETLWPPGP